MAAILDAAVVVLAERPDARIEDVARAAGLTRQTVYAHYTSREALLDAVLDRVAGQVVAALDAARLDEGPATSALSRLLDAGWQPFHHSPLLLRVPVAAGSPRGDRERHLPIRDRLEQVVRRGQGAGEFPADVSPGWVVTATIALGHAVGEEVRSGRMTAGEGTTTLRRSVLRMVGAGDREWTGGGRDGS
jgi:AcrR family transcriptional regulator